MRSLNQAGSTAPEVQSSSPDTPQQNTENSEKKNLFVDLKNRITELKKQPNITPDQVANEALKTINSFFKGEKDSSYKRTILVQLIVQLNELKQGTKLEFTEIDQFAKLGVTKLKNELQIILKENYNILLPTEDQQDIIPPAPSSTPSPPSAPVPIPAPVPNYKGEFAKSLVTQDFEEDKAEKGQEKFVEHIMSNVNNFLARNFSDEELKTDPEKRQKALGGALKLALDQNNQEFLRAKQEKISNNSTLKNIWNEFREKQGKTLNRIKWAGTGTLLIASLPLGTLALVGASKDLIKKARTRDRISTSDAYTQLAIIQQRELANATKFNSKTNNIDDLYSKRYSTDIKQAYASIERELLSSFRGYESIFSSSKHGVDNSKSIIVHLVNKALLDLTNKQIQERKRSAQGFLKLMRGN